MAQEALCMDFSSTTNICRRIVHLFLLSLAISGALTINVPTTLLFNTYHDIQVANITRVGGSPNLRVLTKGLQEAMAIDFYYQKQLVCWADFGLGSLDCIKVNATYTGPKQNVISSGVEKSEGLAIDWYTDKIYWTDGETNRIEVATLNGQYQKVLFWTDLDQPRAIALVPSKGVMIWTDWGENPKIERAGMDGDPKSRAVIVNETIFWPNGLAVDLDNEEIYWVDGRLQFLDVMKLDGSNRRTVVANLEYPYSVTFFQKRLYWTDWLKGTINSYNIMTGEKSKNLGPLEAPITVHVWDASLQPFQDNPCHRNNGNCSHLCLLSMNAKGYSCACPTGVKLLTETKCADGPQEMLF
ncbi:unnamed protein product [Hermetia illucens]|nr:unnamed protein product [Hermetia illucens]